MNNKHFIRRLASDATMTRSQLQEGRKDFTHKCMHNWLHMPLLSCVMTVDLFSLVDHLWSSWCAMLASEGKIEFMLRHMLGGASRVSQGDLSAGWCVWPDQTQQQQQPP